MRTLELNGSQTIKTKSITSIKKMKRKTGGQGNYYLFEILHSNGAVVNLSITDEKEATDFYEKIKKIMDTKEK